MAFNIPALDRLRDMLLASAVARPWNGRDLVLQLPGGASAPILSYSSGRVVDARYDSSGGLITVRSPNGYTYTYRQVGSLLNREDRNGGPLQGGTLTQPGDLVLAGQVLGFQQPTGFAFSLQNAAGQYVDPAAGNGANVRSIFYRIYHALGLGGGTIGSGQITSIPDPTRLSYSPVPDPLPVDPSQQGGEPPAGQQAGYNGSSGYPTATLVDDGGGGGIGLPGIKLPDLTDPGAVVMGCLAETGAVLALALIGIILLIAGLQALNQEKPVKAVAQPVEGAIKTAGTAAKAGAVAAI